MFVMRRAFQCTALLIPSFTVSFQSPAAVVRFSSVLQKSVSRLMRTTTTSVGSSSSKYNDDVPPGLLAEAWTPLLLRLEEWPSTKISDDMMKVTCAIKRTIPLLQDASSVPFVCRYRTDIIDPLSTKQVHQLQMYVAQHTSLQTLREKLMEHLSSQNDGGDDDSGVKYQVLTSISKSELDDLYAPFKPPPKGSILQRIRSEYPELVEAVEKVWKGEEESPSLTKLLSNQKKYPRDSMIHLFGSKIAAEPNVASIVWEEINRHCCIKTSLSPSSSSSSSSSGRSKDDGSKYADTYRNYQEFSRHNKALKDHHVLAIRRGVNQKAIKMAYEIDGTKIEGRIRYQLMHTDTGSTSKKSIIQSAFEKRQDILVEAVHDAWTRLLRRRATTRLWSEKCKVAEERACQVFQDNLRRALLAPPRLPPQPVLSLDPGFKAGIKCAILEDDGTVAWLENIKFLGNERDGAIQQLIHLLESTQMKQSNKDDDVLVAVGNGHGSQDCRKLIQEASAKCNIPIEVQLVDEAGASVWSVTEAANQEFPKEQPAAIASVSIGRRLQNPLFELVKIPPRSLGLGMYQHDLSDMELDERLHLTSVDAVATVGVDINTCSVQILQKVPGLSKLAEKVAKARPFTRRQELLQVSGLGAKTYENCAGFLRIPNGSEPLDNTLVHPESYEVAESLLRKLSWDLDKPERAVKQIESLARQDWRSHFEHEVGAISTEFNISKERTLAILENLIDSLLKLDPRLEDDRKERTTSGDAGDVVGAIAQCSVLASELAEDLDRLKAAAPVRNVIGTVRNIPDFGAFIDFGGPSDGLLHKSQLGPLKLPNLLIGQQIGVDILQVENRRVSLGISGLNLQPPQKSSNVIVMRQLAATTSTRTRGSKRSMSTKVTMPNKKWKTKH